MSDQNPILNRLQEANQVSETDPSFNLPRIAFKMATGTGKTVVMAMLMFHLKYINTSPVMIFMMLMVI
jgi:type III restriction enzyme